MSKLFIEGGHRLEGEYRVKGAKNSILPIMASTLALPGEYCLINCPRISDVDNMANILIHLGADVFRYKDAIFIDSTHIRENHIPNELMTRLRSSIYLMGALLSRCGHVYISKPGGCDIGERNTDLHYYGLSQLGVKTIKESDYSKCYCDHLRGALVNLPFPSVGATVNIILCALGAEGTTSIINAAREPEIVDLQCFLNNCGVKIKGAGTWKITVEGRVPGSRIVKTHKPYRIMGDRIEGATYLVAARGTRGRIEINGLNPQTLGEVLKALKQTDGIVKAGRDYISLIGDKPIKGGLHIRTNPYPNFPTDCQQIFMALLSYGDAKSTITENLFENRFSLGNILNNMGGNIEIYGENAIINTVKKYEGKAITATDLRCGAALVVAGLMAEGVTTISNARLIQRGYEEIDLGLRSLGGMIYEEVHF